MKYMTLQITSVIALTLLMTSCYTDFDPEADYTPVLCMNSVIESGEPIGVDLTRTFKWTEGSWSWDYEHRNGQMVTDARISLIVDGTLRDTMTFTEEGPDNEAGNPQRGYFSDYRPAEGETIELVAISPTYGTASATVVMPGKVEIEKIDATPLQWKGYDYSYLTSFVVSQTYSVWFTDPVETDNFYRLLVSAVNPEPINTGTWAEDLWSGSYERQYAAGFQYINIDRGNEPLFNEQADVLDIMFGANSNYLTLFSDRSISGKRYPVILDLERGDLNIYNPEKIESLYDVKLKFDLYNVSDSYYNWFIYDWYKSESVQGQLGDIGLSEMVLPTSNVSTNAGVVAAFTRSSMEISFADFLREHTEGKHYE